MKFVLLAGKVLHLLGVVPFALHPRFAGKYLEIVWDMFSCGKKKGQTPTAVQSSLFSLQLRQYDHESSLLAK